MKTTWTPGPWKWQGEDYRAGWGWQILVGPSGEGLIVGEGHDGKPFKGLRAHMPLDAALCKTGMVAGPESANAVHVFSQANARLIAAAPEMAEALAYCAAVLAGFRNEGHVGKAMCDAHDETVTLLARINGETK